MSVTDKTICGQIDNKQTNWSYPFHELIDWLCLKAKQKESVFCDCCPEKMEPAIKSCLKCEVSLCKEHLQPHLECQAFLGHTLVPPLGNLSSRRCLEHKGQVLKYYCSVSKTYVCNICALERNQRNLAEESATVLERKLTASFSISLSGAVWWTILQYLYWLLLVDGGTILWEGELTRWTGFSSVLESRNHRVNHYTFSKNRTFCSVLLHVSTFKPTNKELSMGLVCV